MHRGYCTCQDTTHRYVSEDTLCESTNTFVEIRIQTINLPPPFYVF